MSNDRIRAADGSPVSDLFMLLVDTGKGLHRLRDEANPYITEKLDKRLAKLQSKAEALADDIGKIVFNERD